MKYLLKPAAYSTAAIIIFSLTAPQALSEDLVEDLKSLDASAIESGLLEDGNGGFVVEDLVVNRRTDIGDVKLEQDGTFSLLRDDATTVYRALNSGLGAAVNFDVAFARHSIVMTADGQQTLAAIARALKLIGRRTDIEVIINRHVKQDPSGRKDLTKSRVDEIMLDFTQRHGLRNDIRVSYVNSNRSQAEIEGRHGVAQYLMLTVVNQGASLN